MQVGSKVVAKVQFEEQGFSGPGVHVHARPGDAGEVVDVFASGGLMIRWARSGTACDADASELSAAR